LHTIVEIPLEPPSRLVCSRDDPSARGGEFRAAPIQLALAIAQVTKRQQRVERIG
jgi:hypothetical protein